MENRNYYEFLGVSQDASLEEIIKAYRDLSKKTHPDIGGDAEEFKKIQKAFETLYDKDKRNQYDLGVREKRSEEPKEYQQEKPYYKQENKTSDFGKIWRGVEQVLKERYGVKENSKIEELEIIEQLKKQYYQYAVEKRWSELSNKEKQEYEVYTVVGKELKTLGENKAIENYKQKIEEKRKALSVLHLGEVSKDFFYGVLQDFWIEDSVRKNRRFRGDTINVPSRLSVTIKQMDPQQFLYWQHQVEDRIKKMFKEKAEKIIQQKNQGNK
ncbi:MAG: DnaJ domain-containing protein [Candidatus Staskawiczbacteria bacterium]|nr:DnaJ domain-containing protein [Candidatus Staskawiczbacteria bacterium]MBI3337506.1 DnaJ domain-containing protein [Candidatus Staskawiczbacteria bacterium]